MSDVQQELPAAQRERIEGIGVNDAAAAHKHWNNVTLWMAAATLQISSRFATQKWLQTLNSPPPASVSRKTQICGAC
jgi:hypothetical protein